jgi:predicted nuclease with TOPRIM domain
MADEPESLVLAMLRRMDAKLDDVVREVRDLRERVGSVETTLAGVRRDLAHLAETDARLQAGMDRLRDDVERIKRRLDLSDDPPPRLA